jgi:hypothetical protein
MTSLQALPPQTVDQGAKAQASCARFGNRLILVAIAALLVGAALAGAAGTYMGSGPETLRRTQMVGTVVGSVALVLSPCALCVQLRDHETGSPLHVSRADRRITALSYAAIGATLLLYSGLLAALRAGNPSPPMLATGIGLGAVGGLFLGLGLYAKLTTPKTAEGTSAQEAR